MTKRYRKKKKGEKVKKKKVDHSITINDHFEDYVFDWKHRFYVLSGGYGSSKSVNTAIKILLFLMEERRTCLVVREVYETHKDSTFALFEQLVESMGLENEIKFTTSPLQIRFKNKSRIIFRGMDKVEKLKSITNVTICWIEEGSEVKYAGFKELNGRLRHPDLSLHTIITTNPTSKLNWTYKHWFINNDLENEEDRVIQDDEEFYKKRIIKKLVGGFDTYYHHSTVEDNYFAHPDYIKQLDDMKRYDPDLYNIARLGRFGIVGKKVLPQFRVVSEEFINELKKKGKGIRYFNGMDWGFEESYNALLRMFVVQNGEGFDLVIFDEYYSRGKDDPEIEEDIQRFKGLPITCDNNEPKTIAYFNRRGFRMRKCTKYAGSRVANTKKVKRFKNIYCLDSCKNTKKELENLTYKVDPKTGEIIEDQFNIDPHTLSAIWYALDKFNVTDLKRKVTLRDLGL